MKRTGFTLIELIISITIFTIVIITVYSVFYMGIKTWRRGQERGSLQKVRLAFLKIEKELKESFFFSNRPFRGTSTEMVFPLSISLSDEDKETVYIITYSVIEDGYTGLSGLTRKEKPYIQDTEKGEQKTKKLLSSKKSIKFEYAHESDDFSQNFEWQENWEEDKPPFGVRISLEMDGSGEIYNKVIFLQRGKDYIR